MTTWSPTIGDVVLLCAIGFAGVSIVFAAMPPRFNRNAWKKLRLLRRIVRRHGDATLVLASLFIALASSAYPLGLKYESPLVLTAYVVFLAPAVAIYLTILGLLLWPRPRRRKTNYCLRRADSDDADLIYNLLVDSFTPENESDLTNVEVFKRWLESGKVLYVIIEQLAPNGSVWDECGFYSIHPLTPNAFQRLVSNDLDYDSIEEEHLTDFFSSGRAGTQPTCLFILDLECALVSSPNGKSRIPSAAAPFLLSDLVKEIIRGLSNTSVESIASLGSSKKGKDWSENFGLKPVKHAYFPAKHDNWSLYTVDARTALESLVRRMAAFPHKDEWRAFMDSAHPYVISEEKFGRAIGMINRHLCEKHGSEHDSHDS